MKKRYAEGGQRYDLINSGYIRLYVLLRASSPLDVESSVAETRGNTITVRLSDRS